MKLDKRKIYYVYEWIRLDTNETFYVGKGKGDRWKHPERNNYFNRVVNKVGLNNIVVSFIHEGLDEKTAFEYEVYYIYIYDFIYEYGMTNIHVGGRGGDTSTGRSEEEKKKTSEKIKKIWLNPEYKKKMIEKLEKAWLDPERRKKASERLKGRTYSKEHKKKMSEAKGEAVVIFKNNEYLNTFSSVTNAAKELESKIGGSLRNGISLMLNNNWIPSRGQLKGYSAMYLSDYEKLQGDQLKISEALLEKARTEEVRKEKSKIAKNKAIVLFKNGEYLNEFSTIKSAASTLQKTVGGSQGSLINGISSLAQGWIPKWGQLKSYSAMYLSDYEKLQEDQLQKIS